jgi:hypothetical protein
MTTGTIPGTLKDIVRREPSMPDIILVGILIAALIIIGRKYK